MFSISVLTSSTLAIKSLYLIQHMIDRHLWVNNLLNKDPGMVCYSRYWHGFVLKVSQIKWSHSCSVIAPLATVLKVEAMLAVEALLITCKISDNILENTPSIYTGLKSLA